MSTSLKRRPGRIAAGVLGVLAIGASGLLGSTAASAAPGNIDTTTPGSITIHKHLETGATTGANPDGTGTVAGAAVAGVEFKIYQLQVNGAPVNLANFSDWNGLSTVKLDANCNVTSPSTYSLGALVKTGVTDATGTITYPVGDTRTAFAVCETNTDNATVGGVQTSITKKASPFVVSVPMPYNNEWIYNVHAYPKNTNASITKDITAQPADQLGIGSKVTFPVTAQVPTLPSGETFKNFVVRDVFDARLNPADALNVKLDGTPLVAGTDYVVKTFQVGTPAQNDVRVVFLPAGLTKLNTAQGKNVTVDFVGTVETLGNGSIDNTAVLFVDNPAAENEGEPGGGTPSNPVTTHWGDLLIQKSDAANHDLLSGAKFEVYAANPAYPAAGGTCTSTATTGSAIAVNGGTEFTTDASGIVRVAGLFVSDSKNAPVNAPVRCYVIKEIAAPAGYTLPTGSAALTAVGVKTGASGSTVDVDVPNTKQNVPDLPLTGAAGQMIMLAGGGALLAVGIVLVVARRRRQAAQL